MLAGVIHADLAALLDRKTTRAWKKGISQVILGAGGRGTAKFRWPPLAGRTRSRDEQTDPAAALALRLNPPSAIASYNAEHEAAIELRQSKYLNNIVEQDHRAIKRIVRPMLGFKTFRCASILIAGIETMHMIQKGQLDCPEGQASSAASQFCSLAV
ncbi:DDE domain-containing protein [Rhizobiales bacterium GAS113]|nr:DDE domain-containing protein [Rhizobiales bacterium GAS113]